MSKRIVAVALASAVLALAPLAEQLPNPAGSTPHGCESKGSAENCASCCYDYYLKLVKKGKKACRVCHVSILGLCLASSHDDDCFQNVVTQASYLQGLCKHGCPN